MKDLNIVQIQEYPKIPEVIGKRRALERLRERINADVMIIREDVTNIVLSGLGDVNKESMLLALRLLHKNVTALPTSPNREILSKQLRFLVLVIENRLGQIDSNEDFKVICERFSQDIGVVPRLNQQVKLPEAQFLPTRFVDTVSGWEKIIWRNPSRDSKTERLGFFSQKKGVHAPYSVRLHLIALDNDEKPQMKH